MNFATFESGECTGTKSWKALKINLAAKSNDIYISAEDSSGNVGTTQITVIRVDKVKPEVVITTPTKKQTLKHNEQSITLRGTASDNIDIAKVAWFNKSTGESGVCSGYTEWKSSLIPLQIGRNHIIITAYDEYNNQAIDTITVTRKS